jgi:ubiquinone/menaquinone biosynthesis C-methylase UbiE
MFIWIWIIAAIILLILALLIVGLQRKDIARKVSFVGIEDDDAVRAYDKISRWPQFEALRRLVVNELKEYRPHGVITDIGCGPGYLIAKLARSLPDVSIVGVDISEEMVQKAIQNLSALGLSERVSFRKGDIEALPFDTNLLDFAVSTLSLHHWSEPKQALKEINRVLKPGGQFLIFDVRRDSSRFVYWLIRFVQMFIIPSAMRRINEPTNSLLAGYTPAEMESILLAAPFKQYRIKPGIGWLFIWGRKD